MPVHLGMGAADPLAFGEGEAEEEFEAFTPGGLDGELPSLGSAHREGECRPCIFAMRQECIRGASCPFCHIITHEERRKRHRPSKKLRTKMARRRDALLASLPGAGPLGTD